MHPNESDVVVAETIAGPAREKADCVSMSVLVFIATHEQLDGILDQNGTRTAVRDSHHQSRIHQRY